MISIQKKSQTSRNVAVPDVTFVFLEIVHLLLKIICWGMGQKPFTLERVGVSEFMKMFVSMDRDGEF
jgi:hypothetical protein